MPHRSQIFDNKMGKLIAEREKASDALEQMQRFSKDDETNASLVQNFLNEGLDLKTTKVLARSANLLINKRSGRAGSYGLVLEHLLDARGQSFKPTLSSQRSHHRDTTAVEAKGSLASSSSTSTTVPVPALHAASSVLSSGTGVGVTAGAGAGAHTLTHTHAHASPNTRPANPTGHNSRSSSPVN